MDAPHPVPTLPPAPPRLPEAPWAPPGMPPQAAPSLPSIPLEAVSPPTPRSRGPLFALLAVIALVAVGVGALFALRGGGGDDQLVEAGESFSLAAAAQQATEASTVRYDVEMSMGGLGEFTMGGGIDNDAQLMTIEMDAAALFGGATDFGGFQAIIDIGNGVMYMSNPAELGLPVDADWVSIDLASIAEQSGMSIEDFQDQLSANPFDVAQLFTQAADVVDVGAETIDGVEVRHYVVTVDLADALAANPQLDGQFDLSEIGADLPGEIDYDVWVTEGNQLRRMKFALDAFGQEMTVEMNITEVDVPLDVVIPDPADVADLGGLFGSL